MIAYRFSFFCLLLNIQFLKPFSLSFFNPSAKAESNSFPNLKTFVSLHLLNLKNSAPQNLRILEPSKKT